MIDKNTVSNLNLTDITRVFCINEKQCEYVVGVLSSLEQSHEEIRKRQKLVKDFANIPGFFVDCKNVLAELEGFVSERKTVKRLSFQPRNLYEADQRKKTRTTFGNLSDISKVLLRYIRLYVNMCNVFNKYEFKSEYMIDLKEYFVNFTTKESFQKFGNTINQLSNIEIGNSNICMNVSIDKEIGKIHVSFVSVNSDGQTPGVQFTNRKDAEMISRLTGVAVKDLCDYLNNIIESMEAKLLNFRDELMFYRFAIRYIEVMKEHGVPISYPDVVGDYDKTSFNKLYSIDLVAKNITKIVPHDIELSRLTVLCGNNNTGKTCYVRSVALAHIFAQAGLPLPALSGVISPMANILSQFAVGEKNLGRFEEEVREVSEIVDKVNSKTLIIFNETFQSTVYEEIAQPYMDILEGVVSAGGHALVVSHNEMFIELCMKEPDVTLLRFDNGHRVVK